MKASELGKNAGLVHRHPHDLRHRYASVKIAEGVPVTQLAAQLGHSKKSLTLDTYSHIVDDASSSPRWELGGLHGIIRTALRLFQWNLQ